MYDFPNKTFITKSLRLFGFILITLCAFPEYTTAQSMPRIGDHWDATIDSTQKILLPPPLGIKNKIDFECEGIKFTGAVSDRKIISIITRDPNFEIGGLKYIGTELSSFKDRNQIKQIRGWGNFLPLSDGWYAVFDFKDLSDTSKVLYLFKKEDH